jgi:hypothetical protein
LKPVPTAEARCALLACALLALPGVVRAQTCCGRLDLPLAASQRGVSREHELLLGAFYEYDRLAGGAVENGFGTEAIDSHRLVLTAGYGVTRWFTPELSSALSARLISQRIASRAETRSIVSLSDTTLLLKLGVVGSGALAPGALRVTVAPGVKLPTGHHRQRDEFGRIPPPTQIGTGAFDAVLALFAALGLDGEAAHWLLVGSLLGRYAAENSEGYRAGHSLELATVLQLQLPALAPFALRLGPWLRFTAPDQQNDVELAASGNTLLGARGGASWSLSDQLALALELLVPIYRDLRGEQLDPVLTGSIGVLGRF